MTARATPPTFPDYVNLCGFRAYLPPDIPYREASEALRLLLETMDSRRSAKAFSSGMSVSRRNDGTLEFQKCLVEPLPNIFISPSYFCWI